MKLYEDVRKRGPKAYKNLIRALGESGNSEAAQVLELSNNGLHQMPRACNVSSAQSSLGNINGSG